MSPLPAIHIGAFDDLHAMRVLSLLDPADHAEAEAVRGARMTHLALFAEWRAVAPQAVLSLVVHAGTEHVPTSPFAVLALVNTGQAGVASAAFLARDHGQFRRELVAVARTIQQDMPKFCAENGIHRIEARAWGEHPRASTFLRLCGFQHETDMRGFGRDGKTVFRQFAWTSPTTPTGD